MSYGLENRGTAGWRGPLGRAWLAVLVWLACLLAVPALAQAPDGEVLLVGQASSGIDLAPHVEVLEDPERRLTVEAVRSEAFASRFARLPDHAGDINFGYSASAYWLRVRLQPKGPVAAGTGRRLLEIAYPSLDRVELYLGDSGEPLVAGDRQPFAERPFAHRNLVFPLELAPDRATTVLLRVRSEGSLTVPLRLWEPAAFERHNQSAYAILALYYGALVALALYNLLLFFAIRDRSYLEYVLFVLGMAIGQLSLNGFGNQFVWPGATWWGHLALPVGFALCAVFAGMFTRTFLDTRRTAPLLDKLLLAPVLTFGAVAATMPFVLPYGLGAQILSVLGPLFAVLAVACGVRCRQKGVPGAGLYLFAWTLFLVGTALLGTRNLGWVPTNPFTTYAMQLGSALEMLLLSFALAERINTVRRERAQAQADALAANQRLVHALKQSEQNLARNVAQRTRQLEAANQLLRASEQRLQHIAHHDPLTGLANRLLLDDRLSQGILRAMRHNCRMGVLLVDLDGFKPVNDNLGHAVGDELLVAVAKRLRGTVRAEDTVARLGGDEFVIVLVEVFDPDDLKRVEAAVRAELGRPFQLGGHGVGITASVGSAIYPENGQDGIALLKAADEAMYRSKEAARPQRVAGGAPG